MSECPPAGVVSVTRPPRAPLRAPLGTFATCPLCGRPLAPEHAHFRCLACGWRDSCCD